VIEAAVIWRELQQELSHAYPFGNAHGINSQNIVDFLLEVPVLRKFKYVGGPNQFEFIEAWIVLDECKESDSLGYLIAYYPERRMYGLAVKDDPFPAFIGCYGSLVETIVAM